jgi:tetratricopeptide (TPR) repeat protein
LENTNPCEVWQQMMSLSFVRCPGSGEDIVLHDEMRPLVRRYCWDGNDPDRRSRKLLSECAIVYYEDALQYIQSEQQRQAYTVELLYHKLYVDLKSGYEEFSETLSRVVNLRLNSVARSLLHEARHFEKEMTATQRYYLKFVEARLLSKEEAAERALNLFQQLEQEAEPQWLDEYRANILFEKGAACLQLSRYQKAIDYFSSAMEIEKTRNNMLAYAYLLSWLGSAYQKQGKLDTALRYYEEGLEIDRGLRSKRTYANTLLSISRVYRLQGRTEEALRWAKTSLRIREDLFKQGKISEVYIGNNYTDIGIVYYKIDDIHEAKKHFHKAHDIYVRTGNKKGLVTVYNHLGEFSMRQNDLQHAYQWFKNAYSTALGIDTEQQINSLNKQGRVLVMEDQYQKAIEFFQRAIDLAKEVHDYYQHAESLIDLADVLKRSALDERSQRALQAASEICLEHNYHYLLGRSKMYEGDMLYQRGDYRAAFRNYGEACYYMTRYNNLEYQRGLRKVIDTLFELPSQEEVSPLVDELVAYWHAQGLEKEYPDFVKSCQEVKSLAEF